MLNRPPARARSSDHVSEHDLVAQIQLRDGSIAGIPHKRRQGQFACRASRTPGRCHEFQGRGHGSGDDEAQADMVKSCTPPRTSSTRDRADPLCGLVHAVAQCHEFCRAAAGHADAGWHDPLYDGNQRWPVVCLCEGWADRAHDAIDFDDRDGASWTLKVRGRELKPRRQATVGPCLTMKSDRIFGQTHSVSDEAGRLRSQRQSQSAKSRHLSYERISWDEALASWRPRFGAKSRYMGPFDRYPDLFAPPVGNVGYTSAPC